MEDRFDLRLQPLGYHRLGDSVCEGRNPSILVPPPWHFGTYTARAGGGK
jgi:hypothetical protein